MTPVNATPDFYASSYRDHLPEPSAVPDSVRQAIRGLGWPADDMQV